MSLCCNLRAQTLFDVKYVYMGTNKCSECRGYMTLLGRNKYGQQLWHKKVSHAVTISAYLNVNNDTGDLTDAIELKSSENQTYMPGLERGRIAAYEYNIVTGEADQFILTTGEANVYYAGYQDNKWGYKSGDGDYTVTAHANVTASDPVLDASKGKYVQTVSWNIDGITDAMLSGVAIMASYDGGTTWDYLSTKSGAADSYVTVIPWNTEKVRYRVIASPNEYFNMVTISDEVPWTSDDTPDFVMAPIHIPGTLTVGNITDSFTDATDLWSRTYNPTVTWDIPGVYADAVSKVAVEYCAKDTGDEWEELFSTADASGSRAVTLPVGIDSLLFRMVITPTDRYSQFKDTSVSDVVAAVTNYAPAFSNIALVGSLGANYDSTAKTYTPTLAYTMNNDLYQTRLGKAFVYYSTDEGATWTLAETVSSPSQSGEVQLSVPADAKKYQFRMGIASAENNVIACGVEENSNVYAYTKSYVLDDNVDYTPETLSADEVKVLRSFVNGRMGTVCLPFDLTAEQIAEGFGSNAEVYEYTSLTGTTMDFSKVTEMKAGKPYLVKTSEDKDCLVFSNVNITEDTKPQLSDVSSDYVYAGTFSPYAMAVDRTELFLTANGQLKYPSSSDNNVNRLRGYRGYFRLANANGSETKISFDGEMTGIENLDADLGQPVRVYNLNGQYLGDSLKGLARGVYLVNGKKVIID